MIGEIITLCMLASPVQPHAFIGADGYAWTVEVRQPSGYECERLREDMEACTAPSCGVQIIKFEPDLVVTAVRQ